MSATYKPTSQSEIARLASMYAAEIGERTDRLFAHEITPAEHHAENARTWADVRRDGPAVEEATMAIVSPMRGAR